MTKKQRAIVKIKWPTLTGGDVEVNAIQYESWEDVIEHRRQFYRRPVGRPTGKIKYPELWTEIEQQINEHPNDTATQIWRLLSPPGTEDPPAKSTVRNYYERIKRGERIS